MSQRTPSTLTSPLDPGTARRARSKRVVGIALAPLLAIAVTLLLQSTQPGLTPAATVVAGVGAAMAVLWITEALPFAVTALLPLVAFPLAGVADFGDAASPYANSVIFLFLGGFILAAALQRWNLHLRLALAIVSKVGTNPTRIVGGLMLATAFVTLWVSNSATTMMMIPVAASILALGGAGERDGNFARAAVLGVAYAATIGGMGSLIAATPNAMAAAYLGEVAGISVTFFSWAAMMMPWVLVALLVTWFLLTRVIFPIRLRELDGGAEFTRSQRASLGRMRTPERRTAIVFGAAAASWVAFPLLAQTPLADAVPILSAIDDSVIAVAVIVALFLVPSGERGDDRAALLHWEDTKDVPWNVLILFGGGLALSAQVDATGLGAWIGDQVAGLSALPFVLVLVVAVVLVVLIGELMSNTAAAALFLPIMGGVAVGLGYEAAALALPIALAANVGFMLPVATPPNAIAYATGYVNAGQMIRAGAVVDVVGVAVVIGAVQTTYPLIFG